MGALTDPQLYDTTPENAWKRLKPKKYSAKYLAAFVATAVWRERMAQDRDLRYSPHAHTWNTRHWVFRRTNLPCLTCDDYVRQAHQLTREWIDDESGEAVEKKRIVYFCPTCQGVAPEHVKPARPHKHRRPADSEWADPTEEKNPDDVG